MIACRVVIFLPIIIRTEQIYHVKFKEHKSKKLQYSLIYYFRSGTKSTGGIQHKNKSQTNEW